jgi:lysophospholipase
MHRQAWIGLIGIALAVVLTPSHAQPDPWFAPLEAAPAASRYRLGSEADLAAFPAWSDLEAATSKQAPLTRGSFAGAAGTKIHYRLYQHRAETRGGVVVVAGRTEGLVMYQELIRDLVANGYSVYIHDHRGQGFSQRLLTADTTMGYVDSFDHYVQDLAAFVAGPVRAARAGKGRPLFLLAHSMGGAVSALYLEQQRDSGIAAAALVTPMMAPWTAGASDAGLIDKLADAYCDSYSLDVASFGWTLAEKYAEGGPFDEQYAGVRAAPAGAPNDLTPSAVRFARHWQARNDARCDGDDCGSPHAKVGGVSYRWFNQSCFASEQARGKAAAHIVVPVLLLQGEKDIVVKPSAQQEFCRHLNEGNGAGYCVGRTVRQALHSIFIEADAYRAPALERVLGFFDCAHSGAARCN